MKGGDDVKIKSLNDAFSRTTFPSFIFALLLFTTFFQALYNEYGANLILPLYLIFAAYDILCSIFTMCIQYGIFMSGKLQQDYKILEHLLHQQKRQMQESKANIEFINIKCHDLKHQLALLGGKLSQDEREEFQRAISIYDSSLKTGNEALDIILAEKSLKCKNNNIKLDCIAYGERLNFMTPSDIYSLFGNAIDNAIEAVQDVKDDDKKYISNVVKESLGMLSIHIENYYEGVLVFENGLPVTTKSDKRYHGFGMRSIKMIVEKYLGNMTLSHENQNFNLNILFPLND